MEQRDGIVACDGDRRWCSDDDAVYSFNRRDGATVLTDGITILQALTRTIDEPDDRLNVSEIITGEFFRTGSETNHDDDDDNDDDRECSTTCNWLMRHLWSLLYSIEMPAAISTRDRFVHASGIAVNAEMRMPYVSRRMFLSLSRARVERHVRSILHGVDGGEHPQR